MELTKTLQRKLDSFKKNMESNTLFNDAEKAEVIADYHKELMSIMPKRGRRPMNIPKTYGHEVMPELKQTYKTIQWISEHSEPASSRIWTMALCKRYQVLFIQLSDTRYFDIHDFEQKTGRKILK